MFVEVILKKIILNQLVKLFPTISRHQMTLHLSNGHFKLQNVPFPEKFAKFPLVKFKSGNIELLEINLNWTALLRKPIKIILSGVKVELEQTEDHLEEPINVKDEINKIEENIQIQVKAQANIDQSDNKSLLQRMIDSIIDNLEISIKDIDVHISNMFDICSVDFKLDSFEIKNDQPSSKKNFKLSQMMFKMSVPDQSDFIVIQINDLEANLDKGREIIHVEASLKRLKVSHAQNTLLNLNTTLIEEQNKTISQKQNQSSYSVIVDFKHQKNHPKIIDAQFTGIVVEWRSHLFYKMQCLMEKILKKAIQTQQSIIVDDGFFDIDQDVKKDVVSIDKAKITMRVEFFKGYFMNHEVCMGVFRCHQTSFSIVAKTWDMEVEQIIRNMEYQDLTNYPHTFQLKDYKNTVGKPFLTTSAKPSDRDNFRFGLHVYDNNCPVSLITEGIYNFVEVDAYNLQLDYVQQPFLRLFDFLVEQIVSLATRDYGPDSKTKKSREEWLQSFINPKFTSLKIQIFDADVRVFPLPYHQQEYITIKCDEVRMTSSQSKSTSRMPYNQIINQLNLSRNQTDIFVPRDTRAQEAFVQKLEYIWEQLILIQLKHAVIMQVSDDYYPIRQISNPIDLNIQFARLLFGWEYDQFIRDVDKKNDITAYLEKLQLQLTRNVYLLVMKILMNNILFDDGNDAWFIFNYKPESKTNPNAIRYQMRVNQIQVDIIDYILNEQCKVISLETNDLILCYQRQRDASSNIDFCIQNIYADQWNPYGTDLEVMGILNRNILQSNNTVKWFEEYVKFNLKSEMLHYQNKHFHLNPKYQLQYSQKNTNQGDKQIQIECNKVEGVLNLQWYFHLLNFFFMDDAVYLIQTPNSLILRSLVLEVVLKELIVILQCPNASNLIIMEGDLLVSFQKNVNNAIHENYHKANGINDEEVILNYEMFFSEGLADISDSDEDEIQLEHNKTNSLAQKLLQNIIDQSPSSTLKAESGKLRVMVCNRVQLIEEDGFSREHFSLIRQREIFSPLQVQWKSQNYLCQCTRQHKMLNESSLYFDKFITQLTFNEFQLLSDTIMFLKDSMYESNLFVYSWMADPYPRAHKQFYDIIDTSYSTSPHLQKLNLWDEKLKEYDRINQNYQLMSNSKKLFNVQAEILFVNDLGGSFVPLVFLELQSFPLMIEQGYMKFLLAGNVQLQANYYNLSCGQMEPMVEKCNFDIALLRNHDSYPRMSFQLENLGQLNINIHQQMICLLGNSLQKLKKIPVDIKANLKMRRSISLDLRKRNSKRKNIFEPTVSQFVVNEKISLFQVQNQSGYNINVWSQKKRENFKDKEDLDSSMPVQDNQKKNFMTRLDDDLMQTFTVMSDVNIDFLNLKGQKITLRNLNLDCFGGRLDQWGQFDQERYLHKMQESFLIYTYVSRISRVFLVTSRLVLINKTQFNIKVRILKNTLEWRMVVTNIEPQAIPVEMLDDDAELQFTFDDSNLIDQQRYLSEPLKMKNFNGSQEFSREMQHGQYKTALRLEVDAKFSLRYNILFQTPITINNCLPLPLELYFELELINQIKKSIQPPQTGIKFKDDYILMDTQNTFQIPLCSFSQQLFMSLKITGFMQSERFLVNDVEKDSKIYFKEKDQNGTSILIKRVFNGGVLGLYFYPKACLINTTLYPLLFYTIDKEKKRIPGQHNTNNNQVLLIDDQTNLMVMLGQQSTNEVSIKGVGETSIELKVGSPENPQIYQLYELGIYITLVCTVPDLGLYSRVIQIAPRYVIINHTKSAIEVQQENAYGEPQYLNVNERIILYWKDCRKEKMIVCRLADKDKKFQSKKSLWRWSGGIYASELRTVHFYCSKKHQKDSESKQFFRAVITKDKSTFYITVYDVSEGQYAYKLLNLCQGMDIYYQQKCLDTTRVREEELLPYNQLTPFAWPYPSLQPHLSVRIQTTTVPKQVYFFLINLSRFDPQQKIKLPNGSIIKVQYWFEKQTKIIAFNEECESSLNEPILSLIEKVMYIRLPLVTISLVVGKKPVELNLVTFQNVEFASQSQNNSTDYQFRVRFIQIDQNNTHDPVYQVILTPQQSTLATGLDDEDSYSNINTNNNALDIKCRKNQSSEEQVILLETFTVKLVPLSVKLDEEYVQLLLEFIRQVQEDLSQEVQMQRDQILSSYQISQLLFVGVLKRDDIIRQLKDCLGQAVNIYQEWKIINISNPSRTIYIKDLVLFPLRINFSFQKSYNSEVLANALGTAISNIEDAPIVLSGFRTQNVYDTTQGITMQLKDHYTFGLVRQVMKLIGSIELIGNPLGLFNRISTGVVDFIEKPFDAIQKGPLELGLGIIEGATSLIKNTIAGTFYSINKVTGGIATQVSMLSMDEQFIQRRRRFMQRKPKQVFEGLYHGVVSILYGVGDGIIGVVQQPYYHGKRYGLSGVIQGSAIGVTGLFIKSIAGVLDAASKTAEGLTNTATHFDDKPNQQRIRPIRPFYGKQHSIKVYSYNDSFLLTQFQTIKDGMYKDIELIDSFQLQDIDSGEMFLLLSHQMIIYATKSGQIKGEIRPQDISKFVLSSEVNNIMRLGIEMKILDLNQQPIEFKIKFKKIPYSQQLNKTLSSIINS